MNTGARRTGCACGWFHQIPTSRLQLLSLKTAQRYGWHGCTPRAPKVCSASLHSALWQTSKTQEPNRWSLERPSGHGRVWECGLGHPFDLSTFFCFDFNVEHCPRDRRAADREAKPPAALENHTSRNRFYRGIWSVQPRPSTSRRTRNRNRAVSPLETTPHNAHCRLERRAGSSARIRP